MNLMGVTPKGSWSAELVEGYLKATEIPIRLACVGTDGYPVVCSLWFIYEDGCLWAAAHKNAHIIKLLKHNPKVGFEVGINDMPYKGVRGKADVELIKDRAVSVLDKLLLRYLKSGNKSLSSWLLSRAEDEYAIKISPTTISSWDFSNRMEG